MKKYILLILSGILLSSIWQPISSNEPSFAKKELEESYQESVRQAKERK